jgi:hypothetical protein
MLFRIQNILKKLIIRYFFLFIPVALCFSQITTPEAYLGYKPGDDFHLATYGQLAGYFEQIASETSPQMHQFQLAYDLVTGTDEFTRFIRDNVILLLVHANPDGMTLVAEWYMQNVGTPYEVSRLPFLYHKYAGHDNNRDSFMANLLETQNMNRVVGREPDEGLLLSGWILGEELIRGKSAILEVAHGEGKIILFGFNFHNRAQSYANFKLLFNAVLF